MPALRFVDTRTISVLKHLRGVPFVLDVQDLWPETVTVTVTNSGMMRNRLLVRVLGTMTARVTAAAEHVVTLSPGMTRVVAERSAALTR